MRTAGILVCWMVSLILCTGELHAQDIGYSSTRRTNLTVKVDGVDEPVYYVGVEVKPPGVISAPKWRSQNPNASGTVLVSMTVTSKGDVTDLKVIQGVDPSQDAWAIEESRKYKFKPSTLNGKPVSVKIVVELDLHP